MWRTDNGLKKIMHESDGSIDDYGMESIKAGSGMILSQAYILQSLPYQEKTAPYRFFFSSNESDCYVAKTTYKFVA